MYHELRKRGTSPQQRRVLLIHPGGPLWAFYNRSILCDRNEFGSLPTAAYKKRLKYPMFLGLDLVRAV
jgi:predicted NUDIX family NTP pyrophosphohydrolase